MITVERDATLSDCGTYRYSLTRWWEPYRPAHPVVFIMLNPSTADAQTDDPTIRRCIGFTRDLGFHGLEVVNLFGYRATNPRELLAAPDPVGPGNDAAITQAVSMAQRVICAWGAQPFATVRAAAVLDLIRGRARAECLGVTKAGHPRHPLYLPRTARPVRL